MLAFGQRGELYADWYHYSSDYREAVLQLLANYLRNAEADQRREAAGHLRFGDSSVEWFKTGRKPPLKDAIFWFYRLHPKDAVAEKDRPVKCCMATCRTSSTSPR